MTDLFPVFPCDGKGVYPSEAVLSASGARLSWENLRCWAYQAAACTEASSLLDFPAPDVDAPVAPDQVFVSQRARRLVGFVLARPRTGCGAVEWVIRNLPDIRGALPSLDALLSEAGEMTRFIEDGGGAPAPPAPQGAPSDA
jgi:hypothetical protein